MKKSKKFGLIVLLTMVILASFAIIVAFAADYVDQTRGVTWKYTVNADGKTATITGVSISKMTKEFDIPSQIVNGEKTYTVTDIGSNAFNSDNVRKLIFGQLTIPDTVLSIGNNAFAGTYIFGDVVIPESVTSIGNSAFSNCDGISSVTIPSNITVLSESLFQGCFALSKVNTENIATFSKNCFYDCPAIYDISITNKARTIGENAFYNCDALDGVYDLSTVTSIATNSFNGCDRIKGFTLPDAVLNSNKELVDFDAKNFIASSAPHVQEYNATENNRKYSSYDGVLLSKDGTSLLYYPTNKEDVSFTTPDSVTTIEGNAFKGTLYLETVVLGNNVVEFKENAFSNSSITHMYIPDSISYVGFSTFNNCTKLEWVVLAKGVQAIAANAFNGCTALKQVIAVNDMVTPPAINASFYYASEYRCVDHSYGYLDKAATCDDFGYNICIICGRYSYLPATNHSGAILETSPVSCTTDGYRVVECLVCGKTEKVVTEKATGHISNGKIFSVPAGFMTPGVKYSTCTVCNCFFVTEYIADFAIMGDVNCNGKIDYTDLKYLTDYVNGNISKDKISTPNADLVRDGVVNQDDIDLLYQYLSGADVTLPTRTQSCTSHGKKSTLIIIDADSCVSDGFRVRFCVNCGTITEEIVTEKQPHNFTTEQILNSTCTVQGQKIAFCSGCNKTVIEQLPLAEHIQSWYTVASQRGYEYSDCKACGTIESRTVDYSIFDSLIQRIPKYYTKYFQPETIVLIDPIKKNYDLALTQDEVDENVRLLSKALTNAQYIVYDTPTIFVEDAPTSAGTQEYEPTKIVVAYMGEDGKTKFEAIDYNAQIKVRGNSTAGHNAKLPFNIKFDTKVDLFDMGASKKYCLLSNLSDSTYIRNAIVFEFAQRLGLEYTCQYRYVDLYTNGTYRGSYMLTTSVDVGEDRVAIDEEFDYLFEIEYSFTKDADDCHYFEPNKNPTPIFGMRLLLNSPEKADMSGASYSKLHTSVANIEFAIYSGDWELIQEYVDVDSVAKYFILHEVFKEIDIFWDSTRFFIEDGKLHGGPAWDFDLSMIHNGGGGQGESSAHANASGWECEGGKTGDSTTGVWASIEWKFEKDGNYRLWFCALYQHSPDFVKLVSEYVLKYNDDLSIIYENKYDERGKLIEKNIIDSILDDEEVAASFIRNRNKFGTIKQNYDQGVEELRDWLSRRNAWMQEFYKTKLFTFK